MNFFSVIFRYRDKKSPDKLGLYPERFHIEAMPERRYLWTSRILVILAVLSFCFNIMLTMILFLLVPQKQAKPALYTINPKTFALEKVLKDSVEVSFRDALSEKYVHDYVLMRHEIPKSTADLFYKWNKESLFYWYSGSSAYHRFVSNLDHNQLKSFIRQKMKRIVEIDNIKKLSRDLWMVEFKTITTTKKVTTPDIILWRAYLRVNFYEFEKYEDIEKTKEEKMNYTANPFGFKVLEYSLAYAGKPQKADNAMQTAKKVFENLEDVVK